MCMLCLAENAPFRYCIRSMVFDILRDMRNESLKLAFLLF